MTAVVCPYCKKPAKLITGEQMYPHRPDLYEKSFYRCNPCDAHVGCHPGTQNPLGRMADSFLRAAKMKAHAAFDPIWKDGAMKRGSAYAWLSDQLGIDKKDCHIGMFDVDMCKKVVDVCSKRRSECTNT